MLRINPLLHSFKRLLHTPASGQRTASGGDLSVLGTHGDSWSSSPYAAGSGTASMLRFLAGEMTVMSSVNRAYAFPVRCVQYLQAAFLKE